MYSCNHMAYYCQDVVDNMVSYRCLLQLQHVIVEGGQKYRQTGKKWVESRGRSWDRWSKKHQSHQPAAQTGYTCTDGVGQKAQGEITILQMCMSGAALRWNDLCHVCGTTCGWWPHQQQPRAALVQTVLDCLRKKSRLGRFSFSDFPLPRARQ